MGAWNEAGDAYEEHHAETDPEGCSRGQRPVLLKPDVTPTQRGRYEDLLPKLPGCSLERSRLAADASREVVERWLLDGFDVSVGHRRCSRDPSTQNDAGGSPAS